MLLSEKYSTGAGISIIFAATITLIVSHLLTGGKPLVTALITIGITSLIISVGLIIESCAAKVIEELRKK